MKKFLKIIISLLLILVLIFVSGIFYLTRGLKEGENLVINSVDLSKIDDGIYFGEYKKGRWDNTLDITVTGHKITEIKIKDDVKFSMPDVSEKLFKNVIESQNTTVDTVSGATVTSKAYLKSIENALTN